MREAYGIVLPSSKWICTSPDRMLFKIKSYLFSHAAALVFVFTGCASGLFEQLLITLSIVFSTRNSHTSLRSASERNDCSESLSKSSCHQLEFVQGVSFIKLSVQVVFDANCSR